MSEPVLQQARWQGLRRAVSAVPAGAWAVGVSGGADSVALLRLLVERRDLSLHVVHLDHETRGEESRGDAKFVRELAVQLKLPVTLGVRSEIERKISDLPGNTSARFRAARMQLFKQVVAENKLIGVVLGHHADDQAETILHRLIRGAGTNSLVAMAVRGTVGGLRIVRPLLGIRSGELREFLDEIAQPWREDSSNLSTKYLRNQLRIILAENPRLGGSLLDLGKACRRLGKWVAANAPELQERFSVESLALLPEPLARHAAGKWLALRGSPVDEISAVVCGRLVEMATDAASPARRHFPGGVLVCRRRGMIFADSRAISADNSLK